MKKIIPTLLMCLTLTSCFNEQEKPKPKPEIVSNAKPSGMQFEVIKIDGCEYISYGLRFDYGLLTHKGNCSNPIHNH
jgi:hypothetical protein